MSETPSEAANAALIEAKLADAAVRELQLNRTITDILTRVEDACDAMAVPLSDVVPPSYFTTEIVSMPKDEYERMKRATDMLIKLRDDVWNGKLR